MNGYTITPGPPDEDYEAEVTELMGDPVVQLIAQALEAARPPGVDYSLVGTGGAYGHLAPAFTISQILAYLTAHRELGTPAGDPSAGALADAVARLASGTVPAPAAGITGFYKPWDIRM